MAVMLWIFLTSVLYQGRMLCSLNMDLAVVMEYYPNCLGSHFLYGHEKDVLQNGLSRFENKQTWIVMIGFNQIQYYEDHKLQMK